ncbi:MAG: DNA-directed RNA polymerase subunit beta [Bifidobacteriaceae bacterium]|nr:DNA-directed RNA polymerase subunit beta [Bifidobacteriaceae bacterium]
MTEKARTQSDRIPERISFGKIHSPINIPHLLDLQKNSFDWLVGNERWREKVKKGLMDEAINSRCGFEEVFNEFSPIKDDQGRMELTFSDPTLEEPPYTVRECKEKGLTYAAPLYVKAEFHDIKKDIRKKQTVFFGDFPLMTETASFIFNGTERVVLTQIARSPGVYFEKSTQKGNDRELFSVRIVPTRGSWLEFEIDRRDTVSVRIDRKRRQGIIHFLKAIGLTNDDIKKYFGEYPIIIRALEKNFDLTRDAALESVYQNARPGEPSNPEAGQMLLENMFFDDKRYTLSKIGRYKLNKKLGVEEPVEKTVLSSDDILSVVQYLCAMHSGKEEFQASYTKDCKKVRITTDDIDHFGNRRVRRCAELIQNQIRIALTRIERVVHERMDTQDIENITPQSLINARPIVTQLKDFFGTSQLSQFMDQNNPLAAITHRRRLSALGPGGLSRERASLEVRDVHPSHYGRMCPIESPEGQNIGLVGSLASYAKVNSFGFIQTPYRKVKNGKVTDEVAYLTADEEANYVIAQANQELDKNGKFLGQTVLVRDKNGEADDVDPSLVDYMDVSPQQMVSVGTSLIPFLEHDDANRALMGANMQRQAVPLIKTEAPFVGTGIESRAAIDAGDVLIATKPGVVEKSSADEVVVKNTDKSTTVYKTNKFQRANQTTCINHNVVVEVGDKVQAGDILADGPASKDGELSLGRNLLVAFMSWEGYNFEDAIILSNRVVQDDTLTSIHIEEYDVDARNTKLGEEEITRDLPDASESQLANLDENGIVRIGAEVEPGDILVGKISPKGETDLTPEERLLRAIFGEKQKEVRDTSLKVPHGEAGTVIGVRELTREAGDDLPADINHSVRVYIANKRKITPGDKLSGRHGNKGVISKILAQEDMPFLPDGTPVDVILNPLGVPGRMNLGQVLEVHLGWIAKNGWDLKLDKAKDASWKKDVPEVAFAAKAGTKVSTPVFDGVNSDVIKGLLGCTIPNRDDERLVEQTGKATLFDGRTGEPFPEKISVGYMYVLKLHHLVDDKIHARSIGPYSMITQQPLGGKAQFGGQRFGEMEVWALEAYGASNVLHEMMTSKSDDVDGRLRTYEAIVKGDNIPPAGIPESFRVLNKEMQSLSLNVEVLDKENNKIDLTNMQEDINVMPNEETADIDLGVEPSEQITLKEI